MPGIMYEYVCMIRMCDTYDTLVFTFLVVMWCHISPDSRLATSCGDDKTVRLWDVQTQDCLRVFFDHDGSVGQARFHPDGTCLAACSEDRTIKVRSCDD